MTDRKGTYVLVLALHPGTDIAAGALGPRYFPPGWYVYVGSALGGLFPRVRRHVRGGGKTHWHIDYLRRHADVVEVWYLVSETRWECAWYKAASTMPGARVAHRRFGSSGCACASHLVHFTSQPSFDDFRRRLGGRGRGLQKLTPAEEGWRQHFTAD